MSSTQESDGNFRSLFGGSKWKIALYVGVPLLGVGVVCTVLWIRRSAQDSSQSTCEQQDDDVTEVEEELEMVYMSMFKIYVSYN